jgi:hypothetical protein
MSAHWPYRWTGMTAAAGVSARTASTALGARLKVKGSMSARRGLAPARRMELTVAKKLKGLVGGVDLQGCEGEPKGIGTTGAADGEGHVAGLCGGGFKDADLGAEDEALGVADGGDGGEDFVANGGVVAAEVEHGDGLEIGGSGERRHRIHPKPRKGIVKVYVLLVFHVVMGVG